MLAYPIEFIRSSGFFYDALLSLRPVIVSSAPFFKIVEEKRLGLRYTKEFSEVLSLVKNEELYSDFQKNIEVFVSEKLISDMSEISRFFGVELEEVHDDLYGEKETYSNINEESL
mgnify:CR=1 FL=1